MIVWSWLEFQSESVDPLFIVTCLWDYCYESVGGESADAAKRKFFPLKAVASVSMFFFLTLSPLASCSCLCVTTSHLHFSDWLEIEWHNDDAWMREPVLVQLRWFLQLPGLHCTKSRRSFPRNRTDWQTNISTFCWVGSAPRQGGGGEPCCTWPSASSLSGSKTNHGLIVLFQLMRRLFRWSLGTVHLSAAPSPYLCDG